MKKVLAVDDSTTMLRIQQRHLQAVEGIEIVTANDGIEALDKFDSGNIDLILSDWNMPNMSGIDFLKAIRVRDRSIPFIMVTTECERGSVLTAVQQGVSDFLVKPFDGDKLVAKVRKWLGVTA